ncbi:MAG: prepilin-type N-terminal cleavage/methylation domain-containing protein [Thermovirgaceae bacterium]|nr:prepilin-type N-terminal cleavage/methylation domain-containing protein [Synergistales bacterium]
MARIREKVPPVLTNLFEGPRERPAYGAKRKRAGFTLVEVLISILILSIALFSMVTLVTRVVALQTDLKEKEEASLEAASVLKGIESLPLKDITEGMSLETFRGNLKYTPQLFIDGEETARGGTVGKTVRLKVSWAGMRGDRELEVVTIISAAGEQTRGKRMKGE